jgi:hypothetical protein
MATDNKRSVEQVRLEIESERERLAGAVDELRAGIGANLRGRLPVAAAAAMGTGFVLAGGIGATMRLLMRRSREGKTAARFGPFTLVSRD